VVAAAVAPFFIARGIFVDRPERATATGTTTLNGDVNCDNTVDLSDAIYILRYLFGGGEGPCAFADSPELLDRVAQLEAQVGALEGRLDNLETLSMATMKKVWRYLPYEVRNLLRQARLP